MVTRDGEHGSASSTTAAANASEAIKPDLADVGMVMDACLLENSADARVERPAVHPER
jgi:hypothetical protein